MLRHILVVLLSAFIGSFAGTALWDGSIGPETVLTAKRTLMFTVVGATGLMATALALQSRGVPFSGAAIILVSAGIAVGAAWMGTIGAFFSVLTSAAFVIALRLFNAYPEPERAKLRNPTA